MNSGTSPRSRTDGFLLLAFCGFLFFYGLGAFGLVGADEPRYAQVARGMLERSDWVTPTLLGKPWLEKPVLYYWEAMLSFRALGVSDQAARIPGAVDAALLIAAIYFFLRRFRPGLEFDGVAITASCAAAIGFAHAAATDMPLTACFAMALLAWYAWYESGHKIYLTAFYAALALGTLAKGPVAPALAAVIVLLFAAVKGEWRAIWRTLWIPGIAVYMAVTLPWYAAVQWSNPEFFRFFILEHNLARFSQDVYHHRQPFWFYLPVFLLATMPWGLVLLVAVGQRVRLMWSEGREALASAEDSWALFLLIWMVVPIVFFSASQSKLPGYILPAVPAAALLVAEYLAGKVSTADGLAGSRRSKDGSKLPFALAAGHALVCGLLVFAAFSAGSLAVNRRLPWGRTIYFPAAMGFIIALVIGVVLVSRAGPRLITRATLFAVVVSVAAVVRVAAPGIDATQSARQIAESVESFSREKVPIAGYHLKREQEYGLEFYLNRGVESYDGGNIPAAAHVLVAKQNTGLQAAQLVPGRRVSFLTSVPAQKLDLFWVGEGPVSGAGR